MDFDWKEVPSYDDLAAAALTVLLTVAAPVSAQETIASDRPGIGSGSFVLERGTFQIEGGAALTSAGDTDVYSLGQLLLRVGLPGPVELQGLLNSFQVARNGGADAEGFQDVGLGAKVGLTPSDAAASVSLLGTVTFPSGNDAFTSDETVPALAGLADFAVSDQVGVSVNAGYSFEVGDAADVLSLIVTPAVSLPGEGNVGLYGGYAGFFSDPDDLHFAEAGVTWLPGPDLQVDVNAGVELDSGDFFVGMGVAHRWLGR